MLKTFKVQLKPNNKQQTRLFEFAYAARFAYNWTVAQFLNSIQQKTDFLEENILRKNFTSLKKQTTSEPSAVTPQVNVVAIRA